MVVGAVFTGLRLEGVLSAKVRRDGANATSTLLQLVTGSRFSSHIQVVLLQGIAFAGFNVIDLPKLHAELGVPVIAVTRKHPNLEAVRQALIGHVPAGKRKWSLIEKLGPMEPVGDVFVQRVGISLDTVSALVQRLAVNSVLPEPLRTAHIIAGGITLGESRHRA